MNKLFPLSVAGAMALGAVGAHASIAAPGSGTSDAVLFAEVVDSSGAAVASYAGDTGKTVSQLLSLSGSTTVLGSDANLAKLFQADNTAAGDTIVWGLLGGQYPTTGNNLSPGNTQLITTTAGNTKPALADTKLAPMVTVYSGGITSLNSNLLSASSIEGTNPATSGVWDVNDTGGLAFWGGALGNGLSQGTTANLYYLTGGGSSFANITATAEGTASLSAGGLTLAALGGTPPPPPVPLPPAAWLFGSGLLGLAGVARRKAKA
jgi:hypothetical protein